MGSNFEAANDAIAQELHSQLLSSADPIRADDRVRLTQLARAAAPLRSDEEVQAIVDQVSQRLFGLGVLEPLLRDPSITEIMVNGPGPVWVERCGQLEPTGVSIDDGALAVTIERIVAPLGLRVDRTMPFVDARLADGSRVHVAVPPLALDGPYLTIRRFAAEPFSVAAFCCRDVAMLLQDAVEQRQSLVVSGGTGSGKTSLLNALAAHVPRTERVITIEDAAELRLPGDHVVRLEARPANAEGRGGITIRTLVRNALRMRPDRIVVGEVRGAEALDMVQAMNTGHAGSMSTVHANSAFDALHRIETMVLMSDVDLPAQLVREHLHSAIDLIVHVARTETGARQVVSVARLQEGNIEWTVESGRVIQGRADD